MNKFLLPLLLVFLAACSSTPPDASEGAQVENRDGAVAKVTASELDGRGLPRELTDPKSILSKRSIYFDLDRYEVKDEYKDLVTAHAKFLTAHRGFKMLIQGHTDERGSSEYNLSLGQKRADALKRSLLLLGAKEDQVESVSLGKEKPRAEGHNETAWAENRRADMLYKGSTGSGEF